MIDGIRECEYRHEVEDGAFQWDKGDGGPAVGAKLMHVRAVAHGPNGDIYIGDVVAGRIRKVDADTGIITTVAGIGAKGHSWDGGPSVRAQIGSTSGPDDPWDGGPAVRAQVGAPSAIRFDGAGSIYFSDSAHHVFRRIDPSGTITTVVGTGEEGFSPDGTPALEYRLSRPEGLEVSDDGVIFVSDTGNKRVRRIGPDGVMTTVAGSGAPGEGGDGVSVVSFHSRSGSLIMHYASPYRRTKASGNSAVLLSMYSGAYFPLSAPSKIASNVNIPW